MNNNRIVNIDTDALLLTKADSAPWTDEEQARFIEALNAQFPDKIKFAHDGYYDAVIVLAGKNYVMKPHGKTKLKIKGSALKDQKKEPALREMIGEIIDAFIDGKRELVSNIYEKYISEVMHLDDIKRWSQKKTVTQPILNCAGVEPRMVKDPITGKEKKVYFKNGRPTSIRSNEVVLWDAIKDNELVSLGDKFHVFPAILGVTVEQKTQKNGKIKEKSTILYGNLQPQFWDKANHDTSHLLKRTFETMGIFESVYDITQIKNYALVKNFKELLDRMRK